MSYGKYQLKETSQEPTVAGKTGWTNGTALKIVLLIAVFIVALTTNLYPIIHSPVKARHGFGIFADTRLYHKLAYNLYEGHGFSGTDDGRAFGVPHQDKPLAYEPAVTRGPVYPVFLCAVYKVFGSREAMASIDTWHINCDRVRIVQGILNALTALLVFGIVSLIWDGCFWPALTAAVLQAFCFYNIYYARALLSESVTTFILTGFILLGVLALKMRKVLWWLAAGMLCGITILSRSEYLPFLLVFSGYIFWVNRGRAWIGFRNAVLFAMATICVVAPWTIRNYCTFKQLIPVSVGGPGLGLYEGTFESKSTWKNWGVFSDEVFYLPGEKERFGTLYASFDAYFESGSIKVQQLEKELTQMAVARIKSRPLDCLGNWVTKAPRLWYQNYIPMYLVEKEASGNWFVFYFVFALLAFCLSANEERVLLGLIGLLFIYLNLILLPLHLEPRHSVALMPGIIALTGIGLGKVFVWIKTKRICHKFTALANTAGTSRCILVISLALLIGLVGAYSNHFHNDFHFDDSHAIVNNAFIRDLRNIPRFFCDATTFSSLPANQSYRPIVSTTLAIDYWLGGKLDPFWFQVSDFVCFTALVLLLGLVIYRLLEIGGTSTPLGAGSTRNIWLAVIAAGWFGLHPANADTVNYIIARSDVQSTLAVIGSFAVYQIFPGRRRTYAYLLPAVIGILAKQTAAMFAPLFAMYWLLFEGDTKPDFSRHTQRVICFLRAVVPAFVLCGAMWLFVQHMTPKTWVAGAANARQYLITQPYVVMLYFKTFFWPRGLSADYDLAPFHTTDDPRFWAGFGFLVFLTLCAVMAAACRRTRVTGFGLLWFLMALLPTSLWPLAEVMNSHRTFFPYAGLIIAVAGLAASLLRLRSHEGFWGKAVAIGGIAMFLCANGYATYQRNKVWKNEESLWLDVTIKSPNNGRGLMNYGNTLMAKGDFKQALDYFYRAQRLTPRYPTLFVNIAVAEGAIGQPVKAEQDFKQALQLAPGDPNSYSYYSRWLLSRSRVGEAVGLLRKALELSPGDLFALGLMNSAQALLTTAPVAPLPGTVASSETYLNLSLKYYNEKRYGEAIAAAEQALKLRPDYAAAYNNICAAYNQLGQYEKAVAAGEQALCYQPDFPLASNNLQYARQRIGVP
ncbi:MAG: tetratricopeptide repeat protein [Verrucomicrobiia bacterium]